MPSILAKMELFCFSYSKEVSKKYMESISIYRKEVIKLSLILLLPRKVALEKPAGVLHSNRFSTQNYVNKAHCHLHFLKE